MDGFPTSRFANSFIQNSMGTIYNLLLLVMVYGLEEFIRIQILRCPCDSFTVYGTIVLAAPAFVLLGFGFMTRQEFWKVIATCSKLQQYTLKWNYLMKSLMKLFQPFLPSVAFVTFALLRGDFFVCIKSGTVAECGEERTQTSAQELTRFHMQSQILGFGLLVGVTVFTLGLVLIRRWCFDDDSLPTAEEFSDLETTTLARIFRQKLGAIVEEDLKTKVEGAFRSAGRVSPSKVFYRAREDLKSMNIKPGRKGKYKRLNIVEEVDELEMHSVEVSQL